VAPPPVQGILETVLFFTDYERSHAFYTDILGMRVIGSRTGFFLFFRAGGSVSLMFDAVKARESRSVPAFGADGTGHVCFVVPEDAYETWKTYLPERGVAVIQEVEWPAGRSFYFHDPDGNVLEIANRDIWPA
jgi:catechol 2,3-dioxygenase-like lactoylglutathione lyase family enzyme